MSKVFCNSKVKTYTPSTNPAGNEKGAKAERRHAKEVPIIRPEFIGEKYEKHMSTLSPSLWNCSVAFVIDLFPILLKWAGRLTGECSGAELEKRLFDDLRKLLIYQGSQLASEFLREIDTGFMGTTLTCPVCGGILEFNSYRIKPFCSSLGSVRINRAYYVCASADCNYTVFPLEKKLGIEHEMLPWVVRQLGLLCQEMPYNPAVDILRELTLNDVSVCVRTAEETCWELADELKSMRDE
jgi:hypothetical protein